MAATPTAAAKTERLLNLVIALLATRRPLTKAQIRRSVSAYAQATTDEAFDRMFERDKDDLRELGIPLVTAEVDALFSDEVGYRIDRSDYALPEIHLEPDERVAVALAARAWHRASLAGPAAQALLKLKADGVEVDDSALAGLEPRVAASDPSFEPLRQATATRTPVRFDYRTADGRISTRHLQPWAAMAWRGRWYVTGFDTDRGQERVFRLGRVKGEVVRDGRAGSYQIPADHEPRVAIQRSTGESGSPAPADPADPAQSPEQTATIEVRAGTGHELRRAAITPGEGPGPGTTEPGWDLVTVPIHGSGALADLICSLGPDAVVRSPQSLRTAVVERLTTIAELTR